ncbi:MAG: tetratricopeptide repeat protein [Brevundimonas sp.]
MTERLKPSLFAALATSLAMGLVPGAGASAAEARPVVRLGPDLSGRLIDPEGRSAYGLFLAGRAAFAKGRAGTAADYLAAARDLAGDQSRLADQAFTAALLAGDLTLAAETAPTPGTAPAVLVEAGRLARVVEALRGGRARAGHQALVEAPIGAPHARAGALLVPWAAAMAGDWTAAGAEPAAADPRTLVFLRYSRAQLLERRGRHAEAEAAWAALVRDTPNAALFRADYGAFLERRGRREEARAVYAAAGAPAGRAPEGLVRLDAGGRPPALVSLRAGAAAALMAAATAAAADQAGEFAVAYLQMALALDDDDALRLRLGQALAQVDRRAAAREVLDRIRPGRPALFASARLSIAFGLETDGDIDGGVREARVAFAAAPDDAGVAYALAALLLQAGEPQEALDLLAGPLLNTAGQGPEVQFLRGVAYESLDRIPEAEAELWAAHQVTPDDATILNYLGSMWVDRGLRVEQGAEMIARAFAAEPENGNIQDSLGWAQYRRGLYDAAVETLEEAVAKEPANPEINGHLGDAYWKVGRRREAGFQWARVLTLDPDADERAAAEAKLAIGLEAFEAAQAAPAGPAAATAADALER